MSVVLGPIFRDGQRDTLHSGLQAPEVEDKGVIVSEGESVVRMQGHRSHGPRPDLDRTCGWRSEYQIGAVANGM